MPCHELSGLLNMSLLILALLQLWSLPHPNLRDSVHGHGPLAFPGHERLIAKPQGGGLFRVDSTEEESLNVNLTLISTPVQNATLALTIIEPRPALALCCPLSISFLGFCFF